jgi:hypothetical protein
MKRIKALSSTLTLLLLLLCARTSSAEYRPSFHLEPSAWRASDIVVVTEGHKIDGTVAVVETWKGALRKGETLSIPELTQFKDRKLRTVQTSGTPGTKPHEASQIVAGGRMILFLKDKSATTESPNKKAPAKWVSASPMWGMRASTVWVENGRTYAFTQLINPGPSLLVDQNLLEAEMKKKVHKAVQTQQELLSIRKIKDCATRARRVRRLAESEPFYGQSEAFDILADCGQAGVPILVVILNDHRKSSKLYGEIVKALARAARPKGDALLTGMVQEETEFLQATTPSLPRKWWFHDGMNSSEATEFRNHYHKTVYVLYELAKGPSEESREAVRKLKEHVDSLPQPEAESWVAYLSKTCDSVLRNDMGERKAVEPVAPADADDPRR